MLFSLRFLRKISGVLVAVPLRTKYRFLLSEGSLIPVPSRNLHRFFLDGNTFLLIKGLHIWNYSLHHMPPRKWNFRLRLPKSLYKMIDKWIDVYVIVTWIKLKNKIKWFTSKVQKLDLFRLMRSQLQILGHYKLSFIVFFW